MSATIKGDVQEMNRRGAGVGRGVGMGVGGRGITALGREDYDPYMK